MNEENHTKKEKRIVADIRRVIKKLRVEKLSRNEYLKHGEFSHYDIYDNGRSWEFYCRETGIYSKKIRNVSDEEYCKRLLEAIKILGRYPKASERKKFGLNIHKRRYSTLKDFIDKQIELGNIPDLNTKTESSKPISLLEKSSSVDGSKHKSKVKKITPPIPRYTNKERWKHINIDGFPYAPHDEQGVVGLFAILCSQRKINWEILQLSNMGIDAICWDNKEEKELKVEFKYNLTKSAWDKKDEDVDFIVCWKSSWQECPVPVVKLKELINK